MPAPEKNQNAKKDEKAESYLHLRALQKEKAGWVRDAQPMKLSRWARMALNSHKGMRDVLFNPSQYRLFRFGDDYDGVTFFAFFEKEAGPAPGFEPFEGELGPELERLKSEHGMTYEINQAGDLPDGCAVIVRVY